MLRSFGKTLLRLSFMKIIYPILASLITISSLHAAEELTHYQLSYQLNSSRMMDKEYERHREFIQEIVNGHSSVMQQFDAFAMTLYNEVNVHHSLKENDLQYIFNAVEFAAERHAFQKRKDIEQTPYIIHPLGVAYYLISIGNVSDPEILIAALLHDTVEDTGTSLEEIEERFGTRVASYVDEVTDNKSFSKEERKRLQIVNAPHKSPGAALIKLADKLYNLRDHMINPPDWTQDTVDAYFLWAKTVVDRLPRVSEALEKAVDEVIIFYWNNVQR